MNMQASFNLKTGEVALGSGLELIPEIGRAAPQRGTSQSTHGAIATQQRQQADMPAQKRSPARRRGRRASPA